MNWHKFLSRNGVKLVVLTAACLATAGFAISDRAGHVKPVDASAVNEANPADAPDAAKARAAFNDAARVFFSPRCSNCHPAGNGPTQGDSMTTHTMGVTRGPDGRGAGELKCTTCHQDINLDGDNMPPGVPDWHMPGPERKMAFTGITAGQLCRNLKDPLQNGGRQSAKEAIQHVSTDPKVLWAWDPGNGRTTPPLSKDEFLKKMNEWVDNGAACPE